MLRLTSAHPSAAILAVHRNARLGRGGIMQTSIFDNAPKVLVACEESQAVTIELRKIGIEAYSCDIIDCSGGHPEWHIKQDVLPLLDGICEFRTTDGTIHNVIGKWDMIIAHPPCTRLTVVSQRWYNFGDEQYRATKQNEKKLAVEFFMKFTKANCNKIIIENPIGIMSTIYKKPTQIVQPYEFGDPHRKATCFWEIGVNPLVATNIVPIEDLKGYQRKNGKVAVFSDWYNAKDDNGKYLSWNSAEIKKARSKTFPGIAKAMAEQWGGELLHSLGSDIQTINLAERQEETE